MTTDMDEEEDILKIKLVQGGETKAIELSEKLKHSKFGQLLDSFLKQLGMKRKDVYLSTDSGKMINPLYYNQTVKQIVRKYGSDFNLYNEKVF